MLKLVLRLLKSLFGFKNRRRIVSKSINKPTIYTSEYIDDMPDEKKIRNNTVYIIGENTYYWLAAFRCPCGCNDIIQLNLLNDSFPSWRITSRRNSRISILPSIERTVGCRNHFTLTKGLIVGMSND